MLNTEQIQDQLNTIYTRRRALNRAAAALNVARAVAHLREQFPTAAYAWVHVGPSAYESGSYAADVLRVHDATGGVLWNTDSSEESEEIESPATDALVYAADASPSSIPTHPGYTHPVAGIAPGTDTGDDPALLVFADVDKAAEAAVWETEVTPVAIPQDNGGPTLVLFAVPSNQVGTIDTFEAADAVKLGPPAVVGPDEFPGPLYSRDRIADAISDACADIAEIGDLGASDAESAMNVLFNVAMTYLDDPGADLHNAVARCYEGEYPRILRDIADQGPAKD